MDRDLPYKWLTVPLQSSVDDKPVLLHLPARNTVSDYATLFDMTLVLAIALSRVELAVSHIMLELLRMILHGLDCLGKCAAVMPALQVQSMR